MRFFLNIPRRAVFLLIAVAVIIPLFFRLPMKVHPALVAENIYREVEGLPPGATILLSFDYAPGTITELQPMAIAILKHAFRKRLRIILMGLWPEGPGLADLAVQEVLAMDEFRGADFVEGVDYVNLGYMAGGLIVVSSMGMSIPGTFPKDIRGREVEEIPMMKGIKNFNNIDFIYELSSGVPGTTEWVRFAVDRYHAKMGTGTTGVQAPMQYPYVHTGQLVGLMGGLRGAADYESLMEMYGSASRYMASQSMAHLTIVVLVILGNIAFFSEIKKRGAEG